MSLNPFEGTEYSNLIYAITLIDVLMDAVMFRADQDGNDPYVADVLLHVKMLLQQEKADQLKPSNN